MGLVVTGRLVLVFNVVNLVFEKILLVFGIKNSVFGTWNCENMWAPICHRERVWSQVRWFRYLMWCI